MEASGSHSLSLGRRKHRLHPVVPVRVVPRWAAGEGGWCFVSPVVLNIAQIWALLEPHRRSLPWPTCRAAVCAASFVLGEKPEHQFFLRCQLKQRTSADMEVTSLLFSSVPGSTWVSVFVLWRRGAAMQYALKKGVLQLSPETIKSGFNSDMLWAPWFSWGCYRGVGRCCVSKRCPWVLQPLMLCVLTRMSLSGTQAALCMPWNRTLSHGKRSAGQD